jgi:hypothetical protein
MDKEINVLALIKGEERYIFLYDDAHRTETLRMLGRYAANPELSFTWYDAAVMSKKIRELAQPSSPYESAAGCRATPRFSLRHEEDMI